MPWPTLFDATRETKALLKEAQNSFYILLCVISELPGWADPVARNTRDQSAAKEKRRTVLNPSLCDQ